MPHNAQKQISTKAWFELCLLSLLWGGSFLSVKIALNELPFIVIVLHRTGWAMLFLWALVIGLGLHIPKSASVWLGFAGMGLLNNILPFALMAWGQQYIESGLTSIFNASTAFFGIVIAALVFADEKLSPQKAIGVAFGICGISVSVGLGALTRFDITSLAQLAVIAGALSYALASVWGRLFLQKLHPIVSSAGMLTTSTLCLFPIVVYFYGLPSLNLRLETALSLGYVSFFATALAYILYYRVLQQAGSGNLMITTLMIPPIAIILGAAVLGEKLGWHAIIGFLILVIGLLVIDGRILYILRRVKKGI